MLPVFQWFQDFCVRSGYPFSFHPSVISPDTTTLFTTSGMQKHRTLFPDPGVCQTLTDIQHCLRLNDLGELGDGTHYLDFHMLGLFSFHQLGVKRGIDFWMSFLDGIGLLPQVVTLHPDRQHWRRWYRHYPVEVRLDPECVWSDGQIQGYCTEFYLDGVEIGNIVNPLGDCLDCGFGGERLQRLWNQRHGLDTSPPTREQVLDRTIGLLLEEGIEPGNRRQGYVLRSLIREQLRSGHSLPDHPSIERERLRRQRIMERLPNLLRKHPEQPPEYFWQTHGIHPDELEEVLRG